MLRSKGVFLHVVLNEHGAVVVPSLQRRGGRLATAGVLYPWVQEQPIQPLKELAFPKYAPVHTSGSPYVHVPVEETQAPCVAVVSLLCASVSEQVAVIALEQSVPVNPVLH